MLEILLSKIKMSLSYVENYIPSTIFYNSDKKLILTAHLDLQGNSSEILLADTVSVWYLILHVPLGDYD